MESTNLTSILRSFNIKVESEQGVGSAFTVTVTLNSSSRSSKADENPALSDGACAAVADETRDSPLSDGLAGSLMLVVEDMEINAEILMSLLEMEDIRSERAENGQVAVDIMVFFFHSRCYRTGKVRRLECHASLASIQEVSKRNETDSDRPEASGV